MSATEVIAKIEKLPKADQDNVFSARRVIPRTLANAMIAVADKRLTQPNWAGIFRRLARSH